MKAVSLEYATVWTERPPMESGGAGLVSTIEDYSVFARMLLDRGSFGKTRILEAGSGGSYAECRIERQTAGGL